MAWATKCDRCGKYFDHHQEEVNGFAFMVYDRVHDEYKTDSDEKDLCPECVESLEDWFHEIRSREIDERLGLHHED